jgi:hypothetical protein
MNQNHFQFDEAKSSLHNDLAPRILSLVGYLTYPDKQMQVNDAMATLAYLRSSFSA